MWRYIPSLILSLLFVPSAVAATQKNVLILHQGSRLLPYQSQLSSEIQKDLASPRFDVQVFDEFLDTSRLGHDPGYALEALQAKYAGFKFDVIVVDGNGPFQVMLHRPPAFLLGVPVVFVTVSDINFPSRLPPNITGVTVHMEYEANVRLATRLQPGLRHFFWISDMSLPGELVVFRNQMDIVDLSGVPVDDLLKRVKSLPPDSAILFDTYVKDPYGKPYVPAEVSGLIAENANAPLYAFYRTIVGKGAVGGVVISSEAVGKQAAKIILGLLAGAPVSRYPVEHSQNEILIDWRNFQRFGFSESRLPSSAIILFRPPTLWERDRGHLIAGGVATLLLAILLIKLGLAARLRKSSDRATRELSRRLVNAQEEERRRLARELHDDVSQRLALVAVHLDTMRISPPVSGNDLIRELTVLYDETDHISSDIHQFSHDLHPAILERLGLASALRRYCAEFSAHRRLSIHMSTTGNETRLDPETALAFFRIGQECVMNAAKHSGATDCKVSLTYAPDRISLVVEDNGRGFDPECVPAQAGLGIQSMHERLRSIDGTLRIQSSALHGTTVFAEAALVPAGTPDAPEVTRNNAQPAQRAASAV